MHPWTSRPDRDPRDSQIQIVRSRPGKPIGGIITGADVVGAYTHYWRGRTILCLAPQCEACESHRTPRWYGFLPIARPQQSVIAIFELTPSCIPAVDTYLETYGTLRGGRLELVRQNNKINSRVCCTISHGGYDDSKLPAPPDVYLQLCRIWEIDPATTQEFATSRLKPYSTRNGNELTPRE